MSRTHIVSGYPIRSTLAQAAPATRTSALAEDRTPTSKRDLKTPRITPSQSFDLAREQTRTLDLPAPNIGLDRLVVEACSSALAIDGDQPGRARVDDARDQIAGAGDAQIKFPL